MKIALLRYDSKDGTFTPDEAEKILSEEGVYYLKKREPIGFRDKDTQHLI